MSWADTFSLSETSGTKAIPTATTASVRGGGAAAWGEALKIKLTDNS